MSLSVYFASCVLVGDPGVGKSSLLSRLLIDEYPPSYRPTSCAITCELVFHSTVDQGAPVVFRVTEIPGSHRDGQGVARNFIHYEGVDCAIIMYDVTNPKSLAHARDWYEEIDLVKPNIPMVFVGNKVDSRLCRLVFSEDVTIHKGRDHLTCLEMSVKSGKHLVDPFVHLTRVLLGDKKASFIGLQRSQNPFPSRQYVPRLETLPEVRESGSEVSDAEAAMRRTQAMLKLRQNQGQPRRVGIANMRSRSTPLSDCEKETSDVSRSGWSDDALSDSDWTINFSESEDFPRRYRRRARRRSVLEFLSDGVRSLVRWVGVRPARKKNVLSPTSPLTRPDAPDGTTKKSSLPPVDTSPMKECDASGEEESVSRPKSPGPNDPPSAERTLSAKERKKKKSRRKAREKEREKKQHESAAENRGTGGKHVGGLCHATNAKRQSQSHDVSEDFSTYFSAKVLVYLLVALVAVALIGSASYVALPGALFGEEPVAAEFSVPVYEDGVEIIVRCFEDESPRTCARRVALENDLNETQRHLIERAYPTSRSIKTGGPEEYSSRRPAMERPGLSASSSPLAGDIILSLPVSFEGSAGKDAIYVLRGERGADVVARIRRFCARLVCSESVLTQITLFVKRELLSLAPDFNFEGFPPDPTFPPDHTLGGDSSSEAQSRATSRDRIRSGAALLAHVPIQFEASGRTERLAVYDGDDPMGLALEYCRDNNLPFDIAIALAQHIETFVPSGDLTSAHDDLSSLPSERAVPQSFRRSFGVKVVESVLEVDFQAQDPSAASRTTPQLDESPSPRSGSMIRAAPPLSDAGSVEHPISNEPLSIDLSAPGGVVDPIILGIFTATTHGQREGGVVVENAELRQQLVEGVDHEIGEAFMASTGDQGMPGVSLCDSSVLDPSATELRSTAGSHKKSLQSEETVETGLSAAGLERRVEAMVGGSLKLIDSSGFVSKPDVVADVTLPASDLESQHTQMIGENDVLQGSSILRNEDIQKRREGTIVGDVYHMEAETARSDLTEKATDRSEIGDRKNGSRETVERGEENTGAQKLRRPLIELPVWIGEESESKTDATLVLYEGDDVSATARAFCLAHGLSDETAEALRSFLENELQYKEQQSNEVGT
eukprot:Rmarinus@m.15681